MRIYLDTVVIIYLIETVEPFITTLGKRLGTPNTVQVCSELSWLECRVKPMREEATVLLAAYERYFNHVTNEMIPLTREVMDHATALRARYSFKTPDAIHLAAAIVGQCDTFLTNDRRLSKCSEIKVEVLPNA